MKIMNQTNTFKKRVVINTKADKINPALDEATKAKFAKTNRKA